MSVGRTARFVAGIGILVLLGVLLPPFVSITRYRSQVTGALSRALGREVTVGSVSLRLLPQPGITLQDFVVREDPRFGAEPMLHASEVVATLRVSSMWRGRFEVASLSLKEPSLNLVRSADGHWNIESLLPRAAQTPTAPTAKPRPESRPRFPYIEASSGRINFKSGEEKKVWTLVDADFALWLASEDEWRTRLRGRPVRTDATLSDTGTIRIDGSLQRTSRLDNSLLNFRMALSDAQLGQLSTLIYGQDRGWRGGTNATLNISGTPAKLTLSGTASVDQFRRYDIMPPDSLRIEVHCTSQYTPDQQQLSAVECHLPADKGELSARGSVAQVFGKPEYDLGLVIRDVPLSYAVAFARRAKKDLPVDLTAAGVLNAALTLRSRDSVLVWDGGGSTRDFTLQSGVLETPLELGAVEFAMQPQGVPAATRVARPALLPAATSYRIAIPAFRLPLGAAQPASAQAEFDRDGFSVNISGAAAVSRLLQTARSFGISAPPTGAQGAATHLSLRIAGQWRGFQQPLVTGTSDLQNVRFSLPGVAQPVQISFASVNLQASQVVLQNVSAAVGPIAVAGWVRQTRGCATTRPCATEFSLRAGNIALDDVNRLLNPRLRSEPWYRRLAGDTPPQSLFARLRADGQISIARLNVKNVALQNVTGTLHLAPGTAKLSAATAGLFGGTVHGDWQADFSGDQPAYEGSGLVQRVALAQVSAAMRDNWATGTADAQYRFNASGWTSADLLKSAAASLDFTWKDGSLRHLALAAARVPARTDSSGALRINSFHGRAALRNGVFTISNAQMDTPSGIYEVSGTATRARELALTFTQGRAQQRYNVGGTLASPRVQAVNMTAGGRPAASER